MTNKCARFVVTRCGVWLAIASGTLVIIGASTALAKQESRTVTARVDYASGIGTGIDARRVPGRFTVPEGYVATDFKYHFHDPAEHYTSTRRSQASVYSITRDKWLRVAGADPRSALQPGKYKFIVGGHPGASGSLSFKLVPTTDTEDTDDHSPNSGRLRNFDATFSPLDDIYILENGSRKRLRDAEGIETLVYPAKVVVQFREGKASSQYTVSAKSDAHGFTTIETLEGQLSNGHFSGNDTSDSRYAFQFEGRSIACRMGIAWSLDGQIDFGGLLILHAKWHHDFGETAHIELNSQKELRVKREAYSSPPQTRNLDIEIHLHLPAGLAPASPTLAQEGRLSTRPPAVGSQPSRAANGQTHAGTARANIWSNSNNNVVPAKPTGVSVDWGTAGNAGTGHGVGSVK